MSIFTIISPAKRLGSIERTAKMPHESTVPEFESRARNLASVLSRKTVPQLMDLMSISKDLGELNLERYKTFPANLESSHAKEAILQFQGDVFQGLELASYGARDNKYLKDHLGILSGMYGILRPFDKMHPYRLEMGSRLSVDGAANLYQFWGHRITYALNTRLKESGSRVVINLASEEYSRSVDFSSIQASIASVDFLDFRNGKWKVISTNAKRARGIMLNWIIKTRPASISALKKFKDGYEFSEEVADSNGVHRLIFHRMES